MRRYYSGENAPAAKLTDLQIRDMRARHAAGETQASLARSFQISAGQTSLIVRGLVRGTSEHQIVIPADSVEVPGWPNYRVGIDGSLYSRRGCNWGRRRGAPNRDGYIQVHLSSRKTCRLHTLVLLAFIGPKPEGMQACHRNGIRTDNRPENLYWGTPQHNINDRETHGNTARGERSGNAKVDDATVRRIRQLRSNGLTFAVIGRLVGLSRSQASRIVSGLPFQRRRTYRSTAKSCCRRGRRPRLTRRPESCDARDVFLGNKR